MQWRDAQFDYRIHRRRAAHTESIAAIERHPAPAADQFIDRQLAALTHRTSQPETTDDARLEMMREQQTLRQLKRQPLTPLAGAAEEPF